MLGWWVTIKNEKDEVLASWETTRGLEWLDKLIEEGEAKGVNELQGYPNKYEARAKKIRTLLFNASFNMRLLELHSLSKFDMKLVNESKEDDVFFIEIWDLS